MHKQVITIGPDGSMSGLQRKPGQGIDLRQFGKADIKRASLIEWDGEAQAWFIDILQDEGKGKLTFAEFASVLVNATSLLDQLCHAGWDANFPLDEQPLTFSEYDDAVRVEIAYLDALRLAGRF